MTTRLFGIKDCGFTIQISIHLSGLPLTLGGKDYTLQKRHAERTQVYLWLNLTTSNRYRDLCRTECKNVEVSPVSVHRKLVRSRTLAWSHRSPLRLKTVSSPSSLDSGHFNQKESRRKLRSSPYLQSETTYNLQLHLKSDTEDGAFNSILE